MKKRNSLIFVLVIIASAGLALLFAPNSGQVTRRKLKKRANDLKDSIDESKDHLISDFKSSYFEAVDEVEQEYELLNKRQEELNKTISTIENELRY